MDKSSRVADTHFRTDHLMGDLKGRSLRGGVVTIGAQGIRFALQIGATMVLARLLVPEDFGLIAMVSAFTGFVGLFKDLGLSMATVQRAEITHDQVSLLFWINVGFSLVLAGMAAAISPLVAWFYGEPLLVGIMMVISITFVCGGLSAQHTALLRRQMRFTALATVEILALLAGAGGAVVLALNGAGYWALVGQVTIHAAAIAGLSWWFSGWCPSRPKRGVGAMGMLKFGGNITGFNLANYLSRNADNLLIGWRWGPGTLGIYSKAYGLLTLPLQQINGPIGSVAIPALSRLQHEPVRYRQMFVSVIEKVGFLTMPLMAFLVCVAPEVIYLVLGPRWGGAAPVFAWLGLAGVLQPVCSACGWLYITQNRSREYLIWGVYSSVLMVASFVIGLPWGAIGVAAAYATMDILVKTPLFWWHVGRRGAVTTRDIMKAVWLPMLAALLTIAGFSYLKGLGLELNAVWSSMLAAAGVLGAVHLLVYGAIKDGRRRLVSVYSMGMSAIGRSGKV